MRFAKGTKVKIAWTRASGRRGFTMRWWNQVDAFIAEQRAAGGTDFRVRGLAWADWRRVR